MTVEEANKKQCRTGFPYMSQVWGPVGGRTNIENIPSNCCANDCMAWRWCDPATKNEGYCGLAGKEGAE